MTDHLKCNFCNKIFKSEPMHLPCGWTVCSEHLNIQLMDCVVCKNHKINLNDCHIARNIEISLLELKLKENLENLKIELENLG